MTDQADSNDTPQMVVEDGLSPDVMARIESMEGGDKAKIIDAEPMTQEPLDTQVDINLDAPPADKSAEDQDPNPSDQNKDADNQGEGDDVGGSASIDFNSDAFEEFSKSQNMSPEDMALKILENKSIKMKVKGKEKDVDFHQIKSAVSREETFQQKHTELVKSEEMKLGTLMKAAQGGDVEAAKKVQAMLIKSTGSDDADALTDKLEDVEGNFDEDSLLVKKQEEAAMDEAFADVKDGVDFQTHMDTIENRLKEFMPSTVYEQYWKSPESRRAMYNLAASGRLDELTTAFESEYNNLPLEKQLELNGNPDLYGQAFISVIRKQNAKKAQTSEGSKDKDGLDSVSSKARPKVRKSESNEPTAEEILAMSKEEFRAYQDKLGIRRI